MNTARTAPRNLILACQGPGISWLRPGLARLGLGAICLLVSACATASDPLTRTTEFDSLVPGWQSKFALEWKVEPSRDGSSIVYGRVSSQYGEFASRFRVLGMAMDSSGKVIGQRIGVVPGGVPGFTQVYFEIDKMVAAASYRVTVWDYSFIEGRGNQLQ